MKSIKDCYKLYNGVCIPCIGFGTWQIPNGEVAVSAVKIAFSAGYRHIDTAAIYGNEESVGLAIRQSGVPREEIFVTSKLWNDAHSYKDAMNAFKQTMERLGLDYLDLYLIHWPNPVKYRNRWQDANAGTWKAFEELYKAGRIRSIGVSNFQIHHIEELLKTAAVVPMVNQIRLCPGDTQDDLVEYCREHNILIEAYSPLGTGLIFDVPEMKAMAEKYNKSIAQICIRWSLQMGFLPLPKSTNPERIKANSEVFDFELTQDDVKAIASLKGVCGYSSDPDKIPF